MNRTLRKPIVAGNWKMNNTRAEAKALIDELKPLVNNANCEVIICVPFTNLETAIDCCKGSNIKVGAQNCHFEKSGAYTGEISPVMLKELGVEYVVLGHSERRQYFNETDETVNKRLKAALLEGLKVILCVGETLEQRESNKTESVVTDQTKRALDGVKEDDLKNIIIAYEPVWAIGTGKTATADQAEEVCAIIRNVVSSLYNEELSKSIVIQYGGSMNAQNCDELLQKEDIDGGLIGGASLKANDFSKIVDAASK